MKKLWYTILEIKASIFVPWETIALLWKTIIMLLETITILWGIVFLNACIKIVDTSIYFGTCTNKSFKWTAENVTKFMICMICILLISTKQYKLGCMVYYMMDSLKVTLKMLTTLFKFFNNGDNQEIKGMSV